MTGAAREPGGADEHRAADREADEREHPRRRERGDHGERREGAFGVSHSDRPARGSDRTQPCGQREVDAHTDERELRAPKQAGSGRGGGDHLRTIHTYDSFGN